MKIIWRTDVHFADQPPRNRVDDWNTTLLGKLEQVFEHARAVKASAILDGGDLFHIKSPTRNSHEMVARLTGQHRAYADIPVLGNVGNHDVVYGDIDNLPRAPLDVLFQSGAMLRCYNGYEHVLESEGLRVKVVGIPYHGVRYDLERFKTLKRGDADHLVVMAHLLASPQGGKMYEGEDVIRYGDLPALCPEASLFLFGHYHKNQGVSRLSNGALVVNTGSLTRGALTEDNLDRVPVMVEITLNDFGVEAVEIPLTVSPSDKVFAVDAALTVAVQDMAMEAFVQNLKDAFRPERTVPLTDVIRGMEIPDNVREKALSYLEGL